MNNVVGISSKPEDARTACDAAELEERSKFVAYVNEIMELYAAGRIDVVCVGYVDGMGVPTTDVGPFPDGLANDVLALGVSMERCAKSECLGAHDRVKGVR